MRSTFSPGKRGRKWKKGERRRIISKGKQGYKVNKHPNKKEREIEMEFSFRHHPIAPAILSAKFFPSSIHHLNHLKHFIIICRCVAAFSSSSGKKEVGSLTFSLFILVRAQNRVRIKGNQRIRPVSNSALLFSPSISIVHNNVLIYSLIPSISHLTTTFLSQ